MAAIQNLAEPWAGHTFEEIEDFVNTQLDEIDEILDEYQYQKCVEQYFTFEAISNDTTIKFYCYSSSEATRTIQVSTDYGTSWTSKTSSSSGTILATLNIGEKLLVKGTNASYTYYSDEEGTYVSAGQFLPDHDCYVYGNVMSLIAGDDFAIADTISGTYALSKIFSDDFTQGYGETILSSEGKEKQLVLPATTLSDYCYYQMFQGCTALTLAPKLPATTLAGHCYDSMFADCSALVVSPELPATTLAEGCYYGMFENCTSLTAAPELPATTLDTYCYESMFHGCTSLASAPALPATTLTNYCYYGMFYNCTSLTTAPALPATTLAADCYNRMFSGCTALTTAPVLSVVTLDTRSYERMFYGCSSLTYIKAMFGTTPGNNYTKEWVSGVAQNGTFVKNASATWNNRGVNGVPDAWTIETATE